MIEVSIFYMKTLSNLLPSVVNTLSLQNKIRLTESRENSRIWRIAI